MLSRGSVGSFEDLVDHGDDLTIELFMAFARGWGYNRAAMNMTSLLTGVVAALTLVVGLLSLILKSYVGEYGKKRGELQAMHEGLDKLVEQVNVVTKRQEEIKAEILTAVWERQTQWMQKKEILFEVLRGIGSVQGSLASLIGSYSAFRDDKLLSDIERNAAMKLSSEVFAAFLENYLKLNSLRTLAAVIASDTVQKHLATLKDSFGQLALKAKQDKLDPTKTDMAKINTDITNVIDAIREDLGLK